MVEQLTDLINVNISLPFVLILLVIGYLIKHNIPQIDNSKIPSILIVFGIIIVMVYNIPYSNKADILNSIVSGIACGVASVGVHQSGKLLGDFTKTNKEEDKNV